MAVARRGFLSSLVLILAGVGRRVWGQGFALRFQPLARPVVIPLAALETPWRAQQFVADGVTLSSAANPNQPLRITGMVVRTGSGNDPDKFTAVCLKCPHEGCDVDFVQDPNRLAPEVKKEIGPWLYEMQQAKREFDTGRADDPTQQAVLDNIKRDPYEDDDGPWPGESVMAFYERTGQDNLLAAADHLRKAMKENG